MPWWGFAKGFLPPLDDQPWTAISVHKNRSRSAADKNAKVKPSGYLTESSVGISRQRATSVAGSVHHRDTLRTSRHVNTRERNEKMPLTENPSQEVTKSLPRGRIASTSGVHRGILKPPKSSAEDDCLRRSAILTHQKKGESLNVKNDRSAYQKLGSSMKGGGTDDTHQHRREKDKVMKDTRRNIEDENTLPRTAVYPQRQHGQAPPPQYPCVPSVAPQSRRHITTSHHEYSRTQPGLPANYYTYPGYGDRTSSYNLGKRGGAEMLRTSSYNGYTRPPSIQCFSVQRTPSYGSQPYSAAPQAAAPAPYHPPGYPALRHEQTLDYHHRQYHVGAIPVDRTQSVVQVPEQRYVRPTFVQRVPQKEEEISLSWPFIDPTSKAPTHQRRKFPQLHFDVGMNPSDTSHGVRAYVWTSSVCVAPSFRPLTSEEKNIPASSHCVLTRMVIHCRDNGMDRWPIVAERPEGLRCIDVFEAIYRTFAVPLTTEELKQYSNDFIDSCIPAFEQRCRDIAGRGNGERDRERKAICRVDMLRTQKIFRGLTKKGREASWTLALQGPGWAHMHAPVAATVH